MAAQAHAVVLLAHRAELYSQQAAAPYAYHVGPAGPDGTDEAIAILAAAYGQHDPPTLLLAGANESTATATFHALSRAGVTAVLLLLVAVPSDAGVALGTADVAGLAAAAWGTRLPTHFHDIGIVGPPIPAARGPPRRLLLAAAPIRQTTPLRRPPTLLHTGSEGGTVFVLTAEDDQAIYAQAISHYLRSSPTENFRRVRRLAPGDAPGMWESGATPLTLLHSITFSGTDPTTQRDRAAAYLKTVHPRGSRASILGQRGPRRRNPPTSPHWHPPPPDSRHLGGPRRPTAPPPLHRRRVPRAPRHTAHSRRGLSLAH